MSESLFARVRVVLINTSHPGNIGASARAMKNMCLSRLVLVDPKDYPSAECTARASGADDLLATAVVVPDLDAALAGCTWVAGASARARSISVPSMQPGEWAQQALEEATRGEIAIVFGRERSGLTNEELDRCHQLVQIPTNPAYASLNLAASVQVLAWEFYRALLAREAVHEVATTDPGGESVEMAGAEEMERFYQHLEQVLLALEFLDPQQPRFLMRRLRRLYNRVRPDRNEINILRGILAATMKKLGDPGP